MQLLHHLKAYWSHNHQISTKNGGNLGIITRPFFIIIGFHAFIIQNITYIYMASTIKNVVLHCIDPLFHPLCQFPAYCHLFLENFWDRQGGRISRYFWPAPVRQEYLREQRFMFWKNVVTIKPGYDQHSCTACFPWVLIFEEHSSLEKPSMTKMRV